MSEETPAVAEGAEGTPQLTAEEQASVDKGREGFSEAPAPAAPAGAPQRPESVPEKFWKDGKVDVEGLAKSYAELEKAKGAAPAETPPAADPANVDPAGKIAKPEEAKPADNPLTALIETARSDFSETKAFSEETATKLAEAGIPPEVQSIYLAGLEALAEKSFGTLTGYVGGQDQYNAMAKWAGEKLSDDELEAFNSAIDNPQLAETAVRGLYARYTAARPSEGRMVAPANAAAGPSDTFASRDDLVKAQSDPRYQTDAAYRNEVMQKLQRSQAAGFRVSAPRMFDGVYRR